MRRGSSIPKVIAMHKPLQTALMAAVFAAMTSPASAQTAQNPASVSVDVGATLPRAAQATRVHLLGLLDLYNIALYAAGPAGDLQRLASPDVAKALRIEITYEEDFRRQLT